MKPSPKHAAVALVTFGVLFGVAAALWPKAEVQQSVECVKKSACLPSYRNTAVCETLLVGVSERELIVRLGQPVQVKGLLLYFEAGADERGPIEVELGENRNAIRLSCRPSV